MGTIINDKKQLSIDLAPMVDLGLLLITFFMFTTTMAKPKALQLQMPYRPSQQPTAVKEDESLTLIPGNDHQLHYYEGTTEENGGFYTIPLHPADSLRSLLVRKKAEVSRKIAAGVLHADDQFTVLIKPGNGATANDIISVIDEMAIGQVPLFVLTDISDADAAFLSRHNKK